MGEISKQQSASEIVSKFTDNILLTLARNECARWEFRKAAVEWLLKGGSPYARHADLSPFIAEIDKENEAREEVKDVVETAIESPMPESSPALKASVTTATLFNELPPASGATISKTNK